MLPSQKAKIGIRKRRTSIRATIDFFPMVGAAVMVLIVVMIAEGSVPHHGWPLDLALASSAVSEPKAIRENAMIVMVSRDGVVFFRNVKIAPEELPARIREAIRSGSEKRVYLRADSRAKYGDVKAVVGLIDEAGVSDVTFLVEKRRQ